MMKKVWNYKKESNVSILPRKNGSKTGDTLPSIKHYIIK